MRGLRGAQPHLLWLRPPWYTLYSEPYLLNTGPICWHAGRSHAHLWIHLGRGAYTAVTRIGNFHFNYRLMEVYLRRLTVITSCRPPRYAPAPLLPRWRRSAFRRQADRNVAVVSHGHYVPCTLAAAAAW